MSLQLAKYLAAAAVALVLIALLAIIGIVLVLDHGQVSGGAPSVVGLFGFVATLVGILTAILQGQATATAVKQVQQQVNGHLETHVAAARAEALASVTTPEETTTS